MIMHKVSVMTVCHKVLQTLFNISFYKVICETGERRSHRSDKVFQHVKLHSVVEIIVALHHRRQ